MSNQRISSQMQLTKSSFLDFLKCQKYFWLTHHDPDKIDQKQPSEFDQKLIREGYEFESYVKKFFETRDTDSTTQKVFETEEGLFARVDVFEINGSGETCLYEIKSSTSVQRSGSQNYIKDACFQKIVAERSGQQIDRVFIVLLNKEYVRQGEIEPDKLIKFEDVTKLVDGVLKETSSEIDDALQVLNKLDIERNGCSCINKTRANHCDAFGYFNPQVAEPSIYSIPDIRQNRIRQFVDQGIVGQHDIPQDNPLSEKQNIWLQATQENQPQIVHSEIRRFLDSLVFPLHFFDYEAYGSAVPFFNGAQPHIQVPTQYSLHILHKFGEMAHKEFLQREAKMPLNLVEQMEHDFQEAGSVVVWNKSYEMGRNSYLADLYPTKAGFLNSLNERIVDLMDPFNRDFVHPDFKGSKSIKNVLRVIGQHDWSGLEVQNGTSAMNAWLNMVTAEGQEAEEIATSLLEYCKMDTMAMVEIHRYLADLIHT